MKKLPVIPFDNQMSRAQKVLGWCYLPLHALVIPLLAGMYSAYSPEPPDSLTVNIIYFALGAAFVLIALGAYLRRHFDTLLDNIRGCLLALLMGITLEYALSVPIAIVLVFLEENIVNPNNEFVMSLAEGGYGTVMGLAIFLGPLVEEPLFRGVVFGTIREKSRVLAYIVSITLFSLLHVWQYALAYADPGLLLYAVQYIPISFALAWSYERSGSIWTPIFFHMILNGLSYQVLTMM